jgi:hypothetical protein
MEQIGLENRLHCINTQVGDEFLEETSTYVCDGAEGLKMAIRVNRLGDLWGLFIKVKLE